jgi:hypothetical protein
MPHTCLTFPSHRSLCSAVAVGLVGFLAALGCGPPSADATPLPGQASPAKEPSKDAGASVLDGGVADVDASVAHSALGRSVFFAFGVAAPDDPQGQKDLLVDQVGKVLSSAVAGPGVTATEVLVGAAEVSPAIVRAKLWEYQQTLQGADTFVIYSHGHGGAKGLALAFDKTPSDLLRWQEYADLLLSLPAKNVVVFTMACHSGALADVLKQEPFASRWLGRSKSGRSFVVLTAVASDETATATDGRIGDPSAIGNPFTFAVRTAIDGQADGFAGTASAGSGDGWTSLRELVDYVVFTAHEKARSDDHHPQFAGELVESERFPLARPPTRP